MNNAMNGLEASKALCVCVRAVDGYSRAELVHFAENLEPTLNAGIDEVNRLQPPAAVPVEALEGLVAKWMATANEAGEVASRAARKHLPDEWSEAKSQFIEQCADELTHLIKERSNG